jgi:RimJ/RimL family protein N-acetyltransferase
MKLETQRLILREYTMDDFDALFEIMSDAETMQHYPAPFDQARTRRWIEWNLENYQKYGWGLWAVILRESGEFIGDCGITLQNIDGQLLPEIGYHLRKDYHLRGLGKEMTRAVRDYFFEHFDFDEVYSYMEEDNLPSYKTAEANGMTFRNIYKNGNYGMCRVYSITREEWKKIK